MKRVHAIYEEGVLKPLEPVQIQEHTRVLLEITIEKDRAREIADLLQLARSSYEGLSEKQLALIESTTLDQAHFFARES